MKRATPFSTRLPLFEKKRRCVPQRRPNDVPTTKVTLTELAAMHEDKAPERFIDPISTALMIHPVLLPCGKRVDRQTIEKHLKTKPTDPYTGLPLRISDVYPDVELEQSIHEWLRGQEKPREPKRAMSSAEFGGTMPPSSSSSPIDLDGLRRARCRRFSQEPPSSPMHSLYGSTPQTDTDLHMKGQVDHAHRSMQVVEQLPSPTCDEEHAPMCSSLEPSSCIPRFPFPSRLSNADDSQTRRTMIDLSHDAEEAPEVDQDGVRELIILSSTSSEEDGN